MTDPQPIIQMTENCVVCGHVLDAENRPESVTRIVRERIFLTIVHSYCAQYMRLALKNVVCAANAVQFAQYALPLHAAEHSRIAALKAARRAKPKASDVKALRVARANAKLAFNSADNSYGLVLLDAQDYERGVTDSGARQAHVDEAAGVREEAWAKFVAADAALLALDPSEESILPTAQVASDA